MRRKGDIWSCDNKHSYDISKKGYVNFFSKKVNDSFYGKEFLKARRSLNEKGIYSELANFLVSVVSRCTDIKKKVTILDADCGEGYFSNKLTEGIKLSEVYATDLSNME